MLRLLTRTPLPKPRYLDVALRNYAEANTRDVCAAFHYVHAVDAQTVARTIMSDIMERIARGYIRSVAAWQFRHHDKSNRNHLPADLRIMPSPLKEGHIHAAAARAAQQIRTALTNEKQQNYRPDYVVVDAQQEEAEPVARHRLWVQWDTEKMPAGFSARIYVWSPLSEDEDSTPFFTLKNLKTYVDVD